MNSVLAIDPGPEYSAWVVLHDGGVDWSYDTNRRLLIDLRAGTFDYVSECAVEMVQSFGMPVGREVFETVLWTGRYVEALANRTGHCAELIYRTTIKGHLCGSARAKDGNIRQVLIDRWGGKEKAIGRKAAPGPLYKMTGDCWSALAVAVTHADSLSRAAA